MLRYVLSLLTFLLLSTAPPYDALKREAERFFDEKSYARAHELYEQASKLELPAAERRWVEFRLADTAWRAADDHRGSRALEEIARGENHDRVWAEANESLGDLTQNLDYYTAALDWWAGSDEIELARRRYLAIVRRMAERLYYGYQIPRDVLVNAIAIADSPQDEMRARYFLAQQLLGEGRPESAERAFEHLEAIIAAGKTSDWYDDALYLAAQNYAGGRVVVVNGKIEANVQFSRALELYRKLVNEFAKGESPFRDDAARAIEQIVAPAVSLSVGGTFLPDSEQEVQLMWRNTKRLELALAPVDLANFQPQKNGNWIDGLAADPKPARQWTFETNDAGEHVPGYERVRLTP